MTRRLAAAGVLGAGLGLGGAAAAPIPRRIVSLNACLDVALVNLAERSRIAALSHYAREPYGSTIAELAKTLPITHENAEEVVALRPDLVLASPHNSLATRHSLALLGVRLETFPVPESVEETLAQMRRVARLVGRPERGEALVARIRAALAAAAPRPGEPRLTAAIYEPNGLAAGSGTLVSEMMQRCGFDNMADRYGLKKWGNIPLESLVANPPQVLLAGELSPGAPTWAERVISHPALARLAGRMYRATFPQRLLYCGGPVLIVTAATLARAREDALRSLAA
jgi:iron complex transport system substrate-binding protein